MAHFEHDSLISLVLKNGSHHGQLADSARFPSLDAPDLDLVGNVRPTPKTWPKAGEHLLFSMLPCLPPPHKEIHSCPEAGRSGPLGIMRTFSESHLFLPGFHFDGSEHLNSKTGKSSLSPLIAVPVISNTQAWFGSGIDTDAQLRRF
eukprot:CAMPEP_0183301278 /NCGR_PEP_ID=MMETSP0160_2-20130417/7447_1 /TAXON_ID=2839 ORGANISM="Odontella Sinensis, Strain Grunow 1884" /NCGR_SAMPLE_ID=MMETSP0160_2 /ASSEMBLY_ACC=CAM_ASM_000250 /LENGTH=146 /DNA_ID=CAMNT_0025463861 /DNA_START=592 /DNA_END=1033 /DNA_ORIENTATION=-